MPNQAPKAKVPHAFKNKKVACILEPLENQTKPAATKRAFSTFVIVVYVFYCIAG